MSCQMHTTDRSSSANSVRRSTLRTGRLRPYNARLGSAIVEFAIVANIVFLTVLISIEFVRMNLVRNLMQDAAYAAVRHTIVPGATAAEAVNKAEQLMGSLLETGYSVTVSNINEGSDSVSVTVIVNMNEVALFTPLFFNNKTLEATASLNTERYAGFYLQ